MSRAERMLPFQRPGTVRGGRPPLGLGVATSVLSVATATAAIYPLKNIAPAVSLSVVYLPAVLLVSAYWGLPLGLFTSLLGAGAFNFFHLPPVGHFTIADGRNWWALGAFMLVAVVVSTMAELARSRAVEAERRRAEADLAAALARELLAGSETADALAGAARRVAEALALRSASIELGATELRVILREAGFEALPASTGEEALDAAALQPPDAGIIDLLLPDMDGIEVCRRLREWTQMPLIVLSAVGEEDAKVRALAAGADDYVTKPFGPRELIARLQANLRRTAPGPEEAQVRVDGLEVDLARRTVRVDGAEVHLTPTEFDLLRQLVRNRGRLLTHRELLVAVWGPGYGEDTQVLRAHIANLRRKIEPSEGWRVIRTDPGVGYRFAG